MTQYVWNPRSGYPIPAGVVGQIAERIERAEGLCAPERLVEVARDVGSPLHLLFGWRDGRGAAEQRLEGARRLLRDLWVAGDRTQVAFVHVTLVDAAAARSGYVSTGVAAGNPVIRAQVREDALCQLGGLERRYGPVTAPDLAAVWAAVDEATARFGIHA